ncbi:MAG: efflux RND transporter permease subunit [Candidatus Cloacimonetes bacterium]|nr:efflux RND transporter permease subunit [Candidatus Cloacimonadota bacterium]
MSLVKFSVNNSALINMIMIIVFIAGIFILKEIPKEEMPAVDFGSFIIVVWYPGVSPTEVEELIVRDIEEEIYDVEDISYITSTSEEGRAIIYVEFEPNADIEKAQNDLTTELDKVTDLPEDAEDPYLMRLNMREINEICDIALGGDFSGNAMREIAEDMHDGLLDIPFISKVDILGTREREIWVEGDAVKLDEYGLTVSDLMSAIRTRNMNVPGGKVNFGKAEFIVRTVGEFNTVDDIRELVIQTDEKGRALRIKDVAAVNDTLEERITMAKLNGSPSVRLQPYKKAEGNIISVMKNVREYVENFRENVPGLEVTIRNDDSIEVGNSIRTLGNSAVVGVILVFLVLFIFIGWRNALFAAWGIPFSFLLTFILMRYFDVTLNNLTLFGLVLVLGMIVDDAIIVLENVHRHIEQGMCPRTAAIRGTKEIMWPVIAAVTTTAAAFLPMLLMQGMMGKFMRVFPIVVSLALFSSLFESLIILPSHIADFSRPVKERNKPHKILDFFLKRYRKAIKYVLRYRIKTMLVVILLMILSLAALAFRLIRFEFFPTAESKTIVLKLKTPVGTNLETTDAVVSQIENYIMNMKESEDVEAIVTSLGQMVLNYQRQLGTSFAQMSIDLKEVDKMKYTHQQIKNSIRSFLDKLPGLYSYQFAVPTTGPPTGKDIEIRVKGDNLERLEYIGEIIKDELYKIPGVADIDDSFLPGKKEIKIYPRHDKMAMYGLDVSQVAGIIRTSSYGSTISEFRGSGIDEYDIIVRLRDIQIDDLEDIRNLRIRNQHKELIPLSDIADFEITSGLARIEHRDKKRIISVSAANTFYTENGIRKKRTTDEVMQILLGSRLTGKKGVLSNFTQRFPGYQLDFGGVVEEQRKSYNSLFLAFGIAILIIFAILATVFRSYVQPLIVMTTIPFSFIGVVIGLLLTGLPFSLGTLVAVVALAGVVVNDSLVLVDFVNKERERGVDRWNSLINAGSIRLRPIILTTVTTIFGVMPMVISTSKAASDWKPVAVSIIFGLAFATLLTLFVIPVIYSLVDSIFGGLKLTRFKTHRSYAECIKMEENE